MGRQMLLSASYASVLQLEELVAAEKSLNARPNFQGFSEMGFFLSSQRKRQFSQASSMKPNIVIIIIVQIGSYVQKTLRFVGSMLTPLPLKAGTDGDTVHVMQEGVVHRSLTASDPLNDTPC